MKVAPNMFLINVSDMPKAKAFYDSLFGLKTTYEGPHFVAYEITPGVSLALQGDWQQQAEGSRPNAELVVNIIAPTEEFDTLYADWLTKGATSVDAPRQEVFGYTFVVADPDGNLIRVAPDDAED